MARIAKTILRGIPITMAACLVAVAIIYLPKWIVVPITLTGGAYVIGWALGLRHSNG